MANRSFIHEITGEIRKAQIPATRYGKNELNGIMIDAGTAKKSTAGYCLYLALNRITGLQFDKSTAGKEIVSFGIRSTQSIGSLYANSPMGMVEFHVLHANTPFPPSIADMNRLNLF